MIFIKRSLNAVLGSGLLVWPIHLHRRHGWRFLFFVDGSLQVQLGASWDFEREGKCQGSEEEYRGGLLVVRQRKKHHCQQQVETPIPSTNSPLSANLHENVTQLVSCVCVTRTAVASVVASLAAIVVVVVVIVSSVPVSRTDLPQWHCTRIGTSSGAGYTHVLDLCGLARLPVCLLTASLSRCLPPIHRLRIAGRSTRQFAEGLPGLQYYSTTRHSTDQIA